MWSRIKNTDFVIDSIFVAFRESLCDFVASPKNFWQSLMIVADPVLNTDLAFESGFQDGSGFGCPSQVAPKT